MDSTPENHFLNQLHHFRKWLQSLGLEPVTIDNYTHYLTQFMQWLEKESVTDIEQITALHLSRYQTYLEKRENRIRGGSLNQNTINNHLQALERFSVYRIKYGYQALPVHVLKMGEPLEPFRQVLTLHEIHQLYQATDNTAYGYRDRAILSIFYGCGLRCREGVALMLDDLDLKKRYVHVRKGKGSKERYVPMGKAVAFHITDYIYNSRNEFMREAHNYLLVGQKGKPLQAMGVRMRIKKLRHTAGLVKNIHLHTLRHSIATHLLQSGMAIEEIAQFLGHVQLNTTQIYTHLADEL